ncbi:MAG TPA: 2-oxo acid dehydrogenase subunit E2 [Spirochaetes bacterium]|nr:2-oxo acid dehydrogenase subunit E2 [Spirochaetota bacterium]
MSEADIYGAPEYSEENAPLLRKVIGKRLLESKLTIPHFYLTVDTDMKNMIELRNDLNSSGTIKISYNDIIIKAVALVMLNHPECNVSYIDDRIRYYKNINVCLAVAVEGGLLTPAVRNCEEKTLFNISEESGVLVEKARNKKLRPRESMGGTFTLSNLGMFGIEECIAIINPPQSMILATGAIREVPVVEDGAVGIGQRMKMTLSCDHRAVDGSTGALFLSELKSILENPKEHVL